MKLTYWTGLSLLAVSSVALAQDSPSLNSAPPAAQAQGGWRRMSPNQTSANQDQSRGPDAPNFPTNNTPVPAQLNLKPGAFITVRIDQMLSSDHNQAGDAFVATLAQPLIVDGVIVAQRGQTIAGRVVEAQKAGRTQGTSRLKIQLTDLTLVDGQVVPIQSELISRSGPTSTGRDAGAIAGTTALGAIIGAAAGSGSGAAIGAGAGAAVGTIGVLLTRGHPTILGPESVLTFRVEAPVTISTEHAPQAFHFVEPGDYNRPPSLETRSRPAYGPPPAPAYYGGYYGPGFGYGYGYGYPYNYGPSFAVRIGPGFYGGRRGFRR